MRVIILSAFYRDPGTRDKLRALAGLGADVIVATPGGTAGIDGPLRIVPIPVSGRLEEPDELRWNARALHRLLAEQRPDLVHVEEEPESALAATAAKLCQRFRIPFVLTSWWGLGRDIGLLDRRRGIRVLERAAAVIGGSQWATALLAARAPGVPSLALPQSGIPLPPAAEREPPEHLTLGFAGRLVPERGLDVLLHSLAQLFGRWRLLVLGTGPEQEAIERIVERHGLASRIEWRGGIRREALAQLWRDADCLVIPTREPTGLAEPHAPLLLEAMSHELAPIVSTAPPLPELVGDAGLVIRTQDELAETLHQLVAEPALTRAIGARARQRVLDCYTVSAIAKRTWELWTGVAGSRRNAAS